MNTAPNIPALQKFAELWAAALLQMMASLGVGSPAAQAAEAVSAPAPTAEEFEKLICLRFTASGAIQGELLWVAEAPAALQFAQLLLAEPLKPDAEFGAKQREAHAEFSRQVAAQVAFAWQAEFGTEIALAYQESAAAAPVTASMVAVRVTGEKFAEASLRLFLEPDLCAALSSVQVPAPPPQQAPEEPAAEEISEAPRSTPLPANLNLVLDVELEATIRFGEREMLLRDIFALMAGAVVELNQMVNEPAELLVAGRLVARGDVVLVDGNFGLRVTEVVSFNERLAAIAM